MKARPGGDKDVEETEPVAEDDGHALIRWCRARRPPDVVGRRPEPRRPVFTVADHAAASKRVMSGLRTASLALRQRGGRRYSKAPMSGTARPSRFPSTLARRRSKSSE